MFWGVVFAAFFAFNLIFSFLFLTDWLIVGLETYPQDMAIVSLAVVEWGLPSNQGPPWSSGKLVCSGGVVFVLVGYDNKMT